MPAAANLQPLPTALLVAERLRRQAKDMILEAEALEASYGQQCQPKKNIAFAFPIKKKGKKC